MSQDSLPVLNATPTRLRYLAALRGVVPAAPDAAFTYLQLGDFDSDELLRMAMANTHGQFFGVIKNQEELKAAEARTKACGVTNLHLADSIEHHPSPKDFICFDSKNAPLNEKEREVAFSYIEPRLGTGSVLCWRYQAYDSQKELLGFVAQKFSQERRPAEQIAFLKELRVLGDAYFQNDKDSLDVLDQAIKEEKAELFLNHVTTTQDPTSGSADMGLGLTSRGFAYVGDVDLPSNYSELVLTKEAQEILSAYREHVYYEPIKDFALACLTRNDVWVRMPSMQSEDMPTLFNHFTFGVILPIEKLPKTIETKGGTAIDLQQPLYTKLLGLMSKLPLGVGDFLSHPDGQEFDPDEVLATIQILVATGLAQPMRGRYDMNLNGEAQIIPADAVKNYLMGIQIASPTVRIASPVIGGSIALSAREALVLQAICRAGKEASANMLLDELVAIANLQPSLAAHIMDSTEPSSELIDNIIKSVVNNDVTRWYAYGLMAG